MQIDYYFYGASPFTYLGHQAIRDVASKHGVELNYKPVDLFALWEVSGAVPPPKRPPVRQRYRLIELQRIAEIRNLPIKLQPAFWPLDAKLCDCCMIAADRAGDAGDFIGHVLAGVWAQDANMADEEQLLGKLFECGFDANAVMADAKSDEVTSIRLANTQDAIKADAVGVPAYVLNGEVFWGQDRIEMVDHALASGRQPFTST